MRRLIFRRLIFAVVLVLLAAALAGPALAARTTFSFQLEPEAAAPDATGHAMLQFFPESGLVCYTIKWKDVGSAVTGGHIHSASGDIVISLFGGPLGTATAYPGDKFKVSDCVTATTATINAILADPSPYYVNLHIDPAFTSAVRGQLD
jgi:hypothetical protein